MLPEAPVRFTTTTVAPSAFSNPGCSMREMASTDPPGGNGTTMVICLVGHSWAHATAGLASTLATKARQPMRDMMVLPTAFFFVAPQTNGSLPSRRGSGARLRVAARWGLTGRVGWEIAG
jgi:hypothetical protein